MKGDPDDIVIPNRCIWCLAEGPTVAWDISHVVPECLGNDQQFLPEGFVCRTCNQYFGTKVEPVLLADPAVHAMAVFQGVVDPGDVQRFRDSFFDAKHPPVGKPSRALQVHLDLRGTTVGLYLTHVLSGRIERTYDERSLRMLSRAAHKIAFESLVWLVYVDNKQPSAVDVYAPHFQPIRDWARYGARHGEIRPVARRPPQGLEVGWGCQMWQFGEHWAVQFSLYGDWYAVSLTSPPKEVVAHLRAWIPEASDDMWVISGTLTRLGDLNTAKSPGQE